MSTNRILALGAAALILYLGFKYGLRAAFPRIEVGFETGVTGRVTGTLQIRNQYSFFLNGRARTRYSFGSFVLVGRAASQVAASAVSLDDYLQKADYVHKQARTTELTVQRGESITRWACPMPTP